MLLIKNGYIKTMAGDDIAGGSVLVGDDGKIAAVGADIDAPAGAQSGAFQYSRVRCRCTGCCAHRIRSKCCESAFSDRPWQRHRR